MLRWDLGWRGPELERLLDAGHASLQNTFKGQLERNRWLVVAEASFNRYGERGRIDLLAFRPESGQLLVIEVKTQIVDLQGLLGALDMKVRLASSVARERTWSPVHAVIPCLVVADSATARRRVAAHAALFSRFSRRGRQASAWVRQPWARQKAS